MQFLVEHRYTDRRYVVECSSFDEIQFTSCVGDHDGFGVTTQRSTPVGGRKVSYLWEETEAVKAAASTKVYGEFGEKLPQYEITGRHGWTAVPIGN